MLCLVLSAHTVNVFTLNIGRPCCFPEPDLGRPYHSHRSKAVVSLTWSWSCHEFWFYRGTLTLHNIPSLSEAGQESKSGACLLFHTLLSHPENSQPKSTGGNMENTAYWLEGSSSANFLHSPWPPAPMDCAILHQLRIKIVLCRYAHRLAWIW